MLRMLRQDPDNPVLHHSLYLDYEAKGPMAKLHVFPTHTSGLHAVGMALLSLSKLNATMAVR